MDDAQVIEPYRTGICLVGIESATSDALRFLITHCNELQRSFEFELIPLNPGDPLVQQLKAPRAITADAKFNSLVEGFAGRQKAFESRLADAFDLKPCSHPSYVIISLARFTNGFYAWGRNETEIIALGGWERAFAPPSLAEYALTITLRLAASSAVPALESERHLGTLGCLMDFNQSLDTVRFKVLNSFICADCRRVLSAGRGDQAYKDLLLLLGKTWLGESQNALSPAGICRKLGYDLFLTRGIKPSWWETVSGKLLGDAVTETIKLVAALLLALLLLRLGLKAAGG
ncbi:MAG: hypothetical protein JO013_07570 [Alphaproteobacteria bacterium]|nr:hypothetical protein [Alphaproteobacteria bacterium]